MTMARVRGGVRFRCPGLLASFQYLLKPRHALIGTFFLEVPLHGQGGVVEFRDINGASIRKIELEHMGA
jgi:hypothetical protein